MQWRGEERETEKEIVGERGTYRKREKGREKEKRREREREKLR